MAILWNWRVDISSSSFVDNTGNDGSAIYAKSNEKMTVLDLQTEDSGGFYLVDQKNLDCTNTCSAAGICPLAMVVTEAAGGISEGSGKGVSAILAAREARCDGSSAPRCADTRYRSHQSVFGKNRGKPIHSSFEKK